MEGKINNIIVNKLSCNTLTNQENKILEEWLLLDENSVIYNDLARIWNATGAIHYNANANVDDEWKKFKKLTHKSSKNKVRKLYYSVSSIAASVIIALGIFLALNNQTITYQYSQNENHFVLPDNSEVWLNKNTSLTLSQKFGKKDRSTELEGEAFFEVEKSDLPFIVETKNGTSVKVVGTSFNLNSYEQINAVHLQVITGTVEFGNKRDNKVAIVEKGNEAIYYKESKKLLKAKLKNKNKLSWRTGQFSFNNDPISDVVNLLGKYLSMEIEVPNTAQELHYSGKFDNPTAYDVAVILSKAFGYDYILTSEKLTFQIIQTAN